MYKILYDAMNLGDHVEKLDAEIEELYNYVSLTEDRKNNNTVSTLTEIATIAVPMTVVAGLFGMNNNKLGKDTPFYNDLWFQLLTVAIVTVIVFYFITKIKNRRFK